MVISSTKARGSCSAVLCDRAYQRRDSAGGFHVWQPLPARLWDGSGYSIPRIFSSKDKLRQALAISNLDVVRDVLPCRHIGKRRIGLSQAGENHTEADGFIQLRKDDSIHAELAEPLDGLAQDGFSAGAR